MPQPKTPTPEIVTRYFQKFETNDIFRAGENGLRLLFHKFCPQNRILEHVLIKVAALDAAYSTNIYFPYVVAQHILNCEFDLRLATVDYELVNDVARVRVKGKIRKLYSFATKYCSHHNPKQYPIFDYFVEKMMMHFQKQDGFSSFTKHDLRDYPTFVYIIKEFRSFYGLGRCRLREIDKYLWLAGKEAFPRSV